MSDRFQEKADTAKKKRQYKADTEAGPSDDARFETDFKRPRPTVPSHDSAEKRPDVQKRTLGLRRLRPARE